jgi:hypothetical protein
MPTREAYNTMSAPVSGPSSETPAATLDLDPGRFRFSVWQNISITIWTAQMTMDAGHRILRLSRQLSRKFPGGRSQVMIVAAGAPAPDDATTELLKEIYDPNVSRILCIASVLEGAGFWASGIRSRMTTMRIAAGNAMAMHTLDTVEQVADWLPEEHAKRTGVVLDPETFRSVLVATRALGTRD